MKKYCECGKALDERLNYCVHCCKEVVKEETNNVPVKKKTGKTSKKYSPLLEIFRG